MKDAVIHLLYKFLKKHKVSIDEQEIRFQLLSHPTYPSLHAITGVLDHFAIDNIPATVATDQETLSQLGAYFFTQIQNDTGEHFVIFEKKKEQIHLVFSKEYTQTLKVEEFLKIWTGVILILDTEETLEEVSIKNFNLKTLGIFILGCIFLVSLIIKRPLLSEIIYLVSTLLGLLISIFIVIKDLGFHSNSLDRFCSYVHKTNSCDTVLKSNGGTLFTKIKPSDAGFIYFNSLLLSSAFLLLTDKSFSILYLISLIVIPITIYSIIYQYLVIKNWCFLCIGIIATIWLQLIPFLLERVSISNIHISEITIITTCFLILSLLWMHIKTLIKKQNELHNIKIEHLKFKRNYTLFNTLLSESEILPTKLLDKKEIILGNKTEKSKLSIVIITNPLCGHCKEVHQLIDNILKSYKKEVQVIIRFNIPNIDPDNESTKIAARLTEVFNDEGEERCKLAMNEIYTSSSPNDWLKTYGNFNNDNYLSLLKIQHQWCVTYDKNFTPEILLNGKSYPNAYNRKELLYFVEDLITQN
ncbi:vitamin K epoxide reductase family protein [uncultured Aquimarina sp.]|uniref:vitamin K epoxide reductase family protein n=1 Tax=uncultured Aquimarina sp. TaxID=575652 RepID=UPI00261DD59E|nr:vitamin K epoxide reductase family protein [uncultured Aquimarina sp.]